MYVFNALVSTAVHMVSEFQFVANLQQKYLLDKVGDDCAVLPKDNKNDLLLTADMLVEDIDFRIEWTTPEFLGHKALAVSLSDIAAMGGVPKWAMLSIGIPERLWKTDFLDRFYAGWHKLADKHDVELIGGDLSRTPDKLVIDSIAGGETAKGHSVLRSGAKPGDIIYVTGHLGGAAGGFKFREMEQRCNDKASKNTSDLILQQLNPQPQIFMAKQLSELGLMNAAIDISDGLSSDLMQVCKASKVGARIDANLLPIDESLTENFSADVRMDLALNGGEDLELLFTANEKKISDAKITGITRIGEITSNNGKIELTRNGETEILLPKGYRHF